MTKKISLVLVLSLSVFIFSGCFYDEEKDSANSAEEESETSDTKKRPAIIEEAEENVERFNEQAEEIIEEAERIESEAQEEGENEFEGAPSVILEDVAGGNATGTAWLAYRNGKTVHKVDAFDMPELQGGDFYEGWLVKGGDFFSTGRMEYSEDVGGFVLNYETDGDKTSYNKVVITSEPDDGNPAPARHIIENSFPSGIDFNIN